MRRSTSAARRACAVGTTIALVGLTTGLGIMTATSASAATDPSEATSAVVTPTDAPSGDATPTPDATPTADASTPTTEPTSPSATTEPSDPTPTPTATSPANLPRIPNLPRLAPAAVTPTATYTATITGDPKVGSELGVKVSGFASTSSYTYAWSDGTTALSTAPTYTIDATEVGKTITVVVTGSLPGETATASTTTPVSETPVFVDADGTPVTEGTSNDVPLPLEAKAGEPFSYTFHATGTPKPTFALAWFSGEDESDPEDPEYTPDTQLPDGITFDAATGTLSGTTEWADYFDFAVTATSGTEVTTQYVELTVDPGAPLGVQVYTGDRKDLTSDGDSTFWIIDTDGTVYTVHTTSDDEGSESELTPGGRPTVKQGGTLFITGGLVDKFGNDVSPTTDDGYPVLPTVTSNVASDVIAPDPELGDFGVVNVTFPHASVHTLTVASGSFSTSFAVQVQPTAVVPAATITPTVAKAPTTGQLAYTGTDSTDALPWALGLVLAGIGLIGARTLRRRRAQR